jgi:hypothetical protein
VKPIKDTTLIESLKLENDLLKQELLKRLQEHSIAQHSPKFFSSTPIAPISNLKRKFKNDLIASTPKRRKLDLSSINEDEPLRPLMNLETVDEISHINHQDDDNTKLIEKQKKEIEQQKVEIDLRQKEIERLEKKLRNAALPKIPNLSNDNVKLIDEIVNNDSRLVRIKLIHKIAYLQDKYCKP